MPRYMTSEEFRALALGCNGCEEREHMGHPDFRVTGKIFASLGPDLTWGMAKLTPEQQQDFMRTAGRAFSPAAGTWGDRGATIIDLATADEEDVRQAIAAAWRNLAPKTSLLNEEG